MGGIYSKVITSEAKPKKPLALSEVEEAAISTTIVLQYSTFLLVCPPPSVLHSLPCALVKTVFHPMAK